MSSRTSPLVAAAALTLALTGCSSDDGSAASTASGRPSVPVVRTSTSPDGGSHATPDEVISSLEAGGQPCEEPMEGTVEGVKAAKSCIFGGTEDVIALVFTDEAEKTAYLAGRDELSSLVVGRDWAVQTVLKQTADKVAAAMGGQVEGPRG